MLSTGTAETSIKMCHVEMEALGAQPDVKEGGYGSHCDQELQKRGRRLGQGKQEESIVIYSSNGSNVREMSTYYERNTSN
jgi:hypothetical protein